MPQVEQELSNQIRAAILDIDQISDIAIYQGTGFARYLMTARVAPTHFEILTTSLTAAIHSLGMHLHRGTRTITHISALSAPVARREQLLSPERFAEYPTQSLDELLTQEEGSALEFKTSALTDVGNAVRSHTPPRKSKVIEDSVIKSVAGLLNADGGTVVIGVAETADFTFEELATIFPHACAVGNYIVVGVRHEYQRKAWDGYERRLRGLLAEHITPDPTSWVDITRDDHAAGPVAIIVVRRPDRWYYATSADNASLHHFYARLGNETQSLTGPRMDAYRERSPRTMRTA